MAVDSVGKPHNLLLGDLLELSQVTQVPVINRVTGSWAGTQQKQVILNTPVNNFPRKSFIHGLVGLVIGLVLAFVGQGWYSSSLQGDANSFCDKFPEALFENGKGVTVSSHTTACTTVGTSVVSYVYVHPTVQRPDHDHLVLIYSQDGSSEPVKVEWLTGDHLQLKLNRVNQVAKMTTRAGAISINYTINGR